MPGPQIRPPRSSRRRLPQGMSSRCSPPSVPRPAQSNVTTRSAGRSELPDSGRAIDGRVSRPPAYLSICAIFFNEAPYLREWVDFHKLVGVERFFLYDHKSTDEWRDVLAGHLERQDAIVHDWQIDPGQVEAYEDCIHRHGSESRWIAFIDIDEFLFSPTGEPVPSVLHD